MTINWKTAQSGNWNSASNWIPAQIPTATDDAYIGLAGAFLVSVNTATVQNLAFDSPSAELMANGFLTVTNNFDLASGTLDISSTGAVVAIDLAGTGLIIDDGELNIRGSYDAQSLSLITGSTGALALQGTLDITGSTLDMTAADKLTIFSLGSIIGGTIAGLSQTGQSSFNAVTWQGPMTLGGRILSISNGLTATGSNGTGLGAIDLGNGGTLDFQANQIFNNAAIGNTGTISAEGTLTLGPGVSITETTASSAFTIDGPGTVLNQSTISLLGSPTSNISATIAMISANTFENAGTLAATSAGSIVPGLDSRFDITAPTFINQASGLIEALGGSIFVSTATDFENDGTIIAGEGSIDIAALLTGSGLIQLQNQGTVELGSAATSTQLIQFLGTSELILDQPQFVASGIVNFTTGATIRLGVPAIGTGYNAGYLQMQTSGGQSFNLAIPGANNLSDFIIKTTGNSTTIQPACFASGTRIATANGEVAVEYLQPGDLIRLANTNELLPATWIGRRHLDCQSHPSPQSVWPIRVAAHAFARNVPQQDLFLSPDHAVFTDDVLIPIKHLCNGTTIAQVERNTVTYYHIELPRHAPILANNLPAESFLGMRSSFTNGELPIALYPDFAIRQSEADSCAPLTVTGPHLEATRAKLASRVPTTHLSRCAGEVKARQRRG